jgi:hypothetical protein
VGVWGCPQGAGEVEGCCGNKGGVAGGAAALAIIGGRRGGVTVWVTRGHLRAGGEGPSGRCRMGEWGGLGEWAGAAVYHWDKWAVSRCCTVAPGYSTRAFSRQSIALLRSSVFNT